MPAGISVLPEEKFPENNVDDQSRQFDPFVLSTLHTAGGPHRYDEQAHSRSYFPEPSESLLHSPLFLEVHANNFDNNHYCGADESFDIAGIAKYDQSEDQTT